MDRLNHTKSSSYHSSEHEKQAQSKKKFADTLHFGKSSIPLHSINPMPLHKITAPSMPAFPRHPSVSFPPPVSLKPPAMQNIRLGGNPLHTDQNNVLSKDLPPKNSPK